MKSRLLLFVVAAILVSASSQAAITKGPYLQNMGRTGVTVCFETDEPRSGTVFWGETESLGNEIASDPKEHNLPRLGVRYQHKVRVSGLVMDRQYHYAIKHGADDSLAYSFRTFPNTNGSSVFSIYGDSRGGSPEAPNLPHLEVIAAMADEQPALFVNTGDLVSSGEVVEDWEYMFYADRDFMAEVPLVPVFGNHESGIERRTHMTGDRNWNRLFATGEPEHPTYYSVDFANVHLIVIDVVKFWTLLLPSSQQMAWLIDDLYQAQADPHTNFVLVFYHYPAFTFKEGRTPDIISAVILEPFLRDKVDAFFYGHDHFYARSTLYGKPHVVTGGGGAGLYDFVAHPERFPWHEYHEKTYHYIVANVEPQQIEFVVIRTPDLAVIDSFVIETDVLPEAFPEPDDDDDDTADDDDDDNDNDDSDDDDDDNDDNDAGDDDSADDDDDDDDDEGCCG